LSPYPSGPSPSQLAELKEERMYDADFVLGGFANSLETAADHDIDLFICVLSLLPYRDFDKLIAGVMLMDGLIGFSAAKA
jgi:hypothetical protein